VAALPLGTPRLTASTNFRLRSSEYAFMLSYDPMRVKVFAHRCKPADRVDHCLGIDNLAFT
jgi:hypothetical protein